MNLFKWLLYYIVRPFHSRQHSRLKKLASKRAQANDSLRKAFCELSEYTGEDIDFLKEKRKKLIREANSKNYDRLSEKELNLFYTQTPHYMYELSPWNAGCGRDWLITQLIIPYLNKKYYKKILDFGGGTGDLCFSLAKEGFDTFYTDLNKPAIEFTKWRVNRRKINIHFLIKDEVANEMFDCIVSFDMFEHLKNLPEKIGFLVSHLHPKGALIFNMEFSGEAMHIQENKRYQNVKLLDSMLRDNGLSFDKKFKNVFFYKK